MLSLFSKGSWRIPRIKSILIGLYKTILKNLPLKFRNKIEIYKHTIETRLNTRYEKKVFNNKRLDDLRLEILRYYSAVPQDNMSIELSAAIDFLKHNPVNYFPCSLARKYSAENACLSLDKETQLYFALINGKRMFFKRGWNESECIRYFNCIRAEQDDNSPHRYLSDHFTVQTGDVVVDAGAAEGIFAIDVIERASKIYLFEADSEWTEALEATFAPWKEKVEIVNKFLSVEENRKSIRLDGFFQNKRRPDFIKVDVDGAEAKVMDGGDQLLSSHEHLKIALCTYHKQEDELIFSELLRKKGFNISYSNGFILFINDELKPPYFRRGVLRAIK